MAVDGAIYVGHFGDTGALEIDGATVGGTGAPLQISGPGCSLSGWGVIDKEVQNSGSLDAHSGTLTLRGRYVGRGNVSVDDSGQLRLEADAYISGPVLNDGTFHVTGGTTRILGGMIGGPAAVVSVGVMAEIHIGSDVSTHTLIGLGTVHQLSGSTTVAPWR